MRPTGRFSFPAATSPTGPAEEFADMAGTKGMKPRQRIVELAAPVFNRQGFVGASMRDLIHATGLEKGGIYNHFGSKEQLALEAYDYAFSRVSESLARSQDGPGDA